MQCSMKYKFSQESSIVRTTIKRRTSKTQQPEPSQPVAEGHQLLLFHDEDRILSLRELASTVESLPRFYLQKFPEQFKRCLFQLRKQSASGELHYGEHFALVQVLSNSYVNFRCTGHSLFYSVGLSLEATPESWLVVRGGSPSEVVQTNQPLRIVSVADNRNLFIACSSNTKELPVLSFAEQDSTTFTMKHYKREQLPALVCNQDVVQLVLQQPPSPSQKYLHCGHVRELLEMSCSSKEIDEESVKLINEFYFDRENQRLKQFQPETEEDTDRVACGMVCGSYWRVCLPESSVYEPVKLEQSLRLRNLTNGLFLTYENSEFGLNVEPSPGTLIRLNQPIRRFDEEQRIFEKSVYYGEFLTIDDHSCLQLLPANTNGFLLELYVENLGELFHAIESFEADTRSKIHPSETLAALSEQVDQLKRASQLYSRIYDGFVRKLKRGILVERAYLFKKTLEIMQTLSRKLRSRSYLELRSGRQEPVRKLLSSTEQAVGVLVARCFQLLIAIMREGQPPTQDLTLLYKTVLDFDESHPNYVMALLELAVPYDPDNCYAKELWSESMLGGQQGQSLNYNMLRIVRHTLSATLDRIPTCDYLSRSVHCQLIISAGVLALAFEGEQPVPLGSLNDIEELEAYECLRLIALNSSKQTEVALEDILTNNLHLLTEYILSDASLRLKAGIMSILQRHTLQPELDTSKPFIFSEKSKMPTLRTLLTGEAPNRSNSIAAKKDLLAILLELNIKCSSLTVSLEMLEIMVEFVRGYVCSGGYAVTDVQLLDDTMIGLCKLCFSLPKPAEHEEDTADGSEALQVNIRMRVERQLQLALDSFVEIKQRVSEVCRFERQWAQRCLHSYYEILTGATTSSMLLRSVVNLLLQCYRQFDEDKLELVSLKRQSLVNEEQFEWIDECTRKLVGYFDELPNLMCTQKLPTNNSIQENIQRQFVRLSELLSSITSRFGELSSLQELQYILNVKNTHVRLMEVFAAGADQIEATLFDPLLNFLELFARHNEINAKALLQHNICWRVSLEQKLLCAVYRFCSLSELEQAVEQLIGIPLQSLYAIMLAVHQEFDHPAKEPKLRHELNTFIMETILQRDPNFRTIKNSSVKFETQINPSMVSQPELDLQEGEAVLYLLAQLARTDSSVQCYLEQHFPIDMVLAHSKDKSLDLATRKAYLNLLEVLLKPKPSEIAAETLSSYLEIVKIEVFKEQVKSLLPVVTQVQPTRKPTEYGIIHKKQHSPSNDEFWRFQFGEEMGCHCYGQLRFFSRVIVLISKKELLQNSARTKLVELGWLLYDLISTDQVINMPNLREFETEVQQFLLELTDIGLFTIPTKNTSSYNIAQLRKEFQDFSKLGAELQIEEEDQSKSSYSNEIEEEEDIQLDFSSNSSNKQLIQTPKQAQPSLERRHQRWQQLFNLKECRQQLPVGAYRQLQNFVVRLAYLRVTQGLSISELQTAKTRRTEAQIPTCLTYATVLGLTWSEETFKNISTAIDNDQLKQRRFGYACVSAVAEVLDFSRLSHLLLAGKLLKEARTGSVEERCKLLTKLWGRLLDINDCRSSLNYGARVKLLSFVRRQSAEVGLTELLAPTEFIRSIESYFKSQSHLNLQLIKSSAEMCAIDGRIRKNKTEFNPMEFVRDVAVRVHNDTCSGYQLIMSILKSEFQECEADARKALLERNSASSVLCKIISKIGGEQLGLLQIETDRLQLLYNALDLILESAHIVDSETFRATTRVEYVRLLALTEHRMLVRVLQSNKPQQQSEGEQLNQLLTAIVLHIRTIYAALMNPSESYLLQNAKNELSEQPIDQKSLELFNGQLHSVQVMTGKHLNTMYYFPGRMEMESELGSHLTFIMEAAYSGNDQLSLELTDAARVYCEVISQLNPQTYQLRRKVEQSYTLINNLQVLLVLVAVINELVLGPRALALAMLALSLLINVVRLLAKWQLLLTNRRIMHRMKRKGTNYIPAAQLLCLLLNCVALYEPNCSGLFLTVTSLLLLDVDKLLVNQAKIEDWSIILYWCLWNLLLFIFYNDYKHASYTQEIYQFVNYMHHNYEYTSTAFSMLEWMRRASDSLMLAWYIPSMLMSILICREFGHQQATTGGVCCLCQSVVQSANSQQCLKTNIPYYVEYFACLLAKPELLSEVEQRLRQAVMDHDSSLLPQ